MPPMHPQRADQADAAISAIARATSTTRTREEGFSGLSYFPDAICRDSEFYDPVERGFEREIKKRLDYWEKLRSR